MISFTISQHFYILPNGSRVLQRIFPIDCIFAGRIWSVQPFWGPIIFALPNPTERTLKLRFMPHGKRQSSQNNIHVHEASMLLVDFFSVFYMFVCRNCWKGHLFFEDLHEAWHCMPCPFLRRGGLKFCWGSFPGNHVWNPMEKNTWKGSVFHHRHLGEILGTLVKFDQKFPLLCKNLRDGRWKKSIWNWEIVRVVQIYIFGSL